jgi:hypothetical protein
MDYRQERGAGVACSFMDENVVSVNASSANLRERVDNALRSLEAHGFTVIPGVKNDGGGKKTITKFTRDDDTYHYAFYTAGDANRTFNRAGAMLEGASGLVLHFYGPVYLVLFELERAGLAAYLPADAPPHIIIHGPAEAQRPADTDHKRLITAFASLQADGFHARAGYDFDAAGGFHLADRESDGDRFAFFTSQEEECFDAFGNLHRPLAVFHSGLQGTVDELKAKLAEYGFTTEDTMPERPQDAGLSEVSPARWGKENPNQPLELVRPEEINSTLN